VTGDLIKQANNHIPRLLRRHPSILEGIDRSFTATLVISGQGFFICQKKDFMVKSAY